MSPAEASAFPIPPKPVAEPPTPVPSKAGRPSKLETRAWELFSRSATVAMSRGQRRDKFNESVALAEDFAAFWAERR